jgi:hypothetical protein
VLWWLFWVVPCRRAWCKRRASCGFFAVIGADVPVLDMLHVAARALPKRKDLCYVCVPRLSIVIGFNVLQSATFFSVLLLPRCKVAGVLLQRMSTSVARPNCGGKTH